MPKNTLNNIFSIQSVSKSLFGLLLSAFMIAMIISCSNTVNEKLDKIDCLIEQHPDSALVLLEGVNRGELKTNSSRAKYALLMSMALDKNYIDTTSFDVLQPAIDHYLKKGAPDERLRTYYYQGVIYMNRSDRDNALNSFMKGLDLRDLCKDSLVIARTLVAEAYIYNEMYEFGSYIENHLEAAKIYARLSKENYETECLLNALNGSIIVGNNSLSDSLITEISKKENLNAFNKINFLKNKLSYSIRNGSREEAGCIIKEMEKLPILTTSDMLQVARAYNKLGQPKESSEILNNLNHSALDFDTIKYLAVSFSINESIGDFKAALSNYKEFSRLNDSIDFIKFKRQLQLVEDKYKLQILTKTETEKRTKILWTSIIAVVILIFIIAILTLLVRFNHNQKELARQRAKATELENAKLKIEKENLNHRLNELEEESASLKSLLSNPNELPLEVRNIIKERIEMLNTLLAGYITDNKQFEKPYDKWVKELTENTKDFMNSNRIAFKASHPKFIDYLEEHGLTESEINYVCLYAIGLRGKEVGNYMKKRSHVNMSSAIRKKFGIDQHETNLGIYVRKLLKAL